MMAEMLSYLDSKSSAYVLESSGAKSNPGKCLIVFQAIDQLSTTHDSNILISCTWQHCNSKIEITTDVSLPIMLHVHQPFA